MAQSAAAHGRSRHDQVLQDDRHHPVGTQDLRLGSCLSQKSGNERQDFDTRVANYVFSGKPPKRAEPGVEFVSEPVKTFAQRLRARPGKHIWMMGGGGLIASFLDAGEIDEFDIHVIPTFIGEGIPLIEPRHRDVPLRLRSARKYPDGVVGLRYEVVR
jgi:dihydrofolate reductase